MVEANPSGTSQTCLCGRDVRKTLAVRVHRCDGCGLIAPRDVVSALLILRLGRSLMSGHASLQKPPASAGGGVTKSMIK